MNFNKVVAFWIFLSLSITTRKFFFWGGGIFSTGENYLKIDLQNIFYYCTVKYSKAFSGFYLRAQRSPVMLDKINLLLFLF